jgi:hypothetical protein
MASSRLRFAELWIALLVAGCGSASRPHAHEQTGSDAGFDAADAVSDTEQPEVNDAADAAQEVGELGSCADTGTADAGGGEFDSDAGNTDAGSDRVHRFFEITVVDAETNAPLPGARLTTINSIVLVSDANGSIAFYEPGMMGREAFFYVERPGYEVPQDGFGYRGKRLVPIEGGSGIVAMNPVGTPPPDSTTSLEHTLLLGGPVPSRAECYRIRAIDTQTRRGIPLVELESPKRAYATDSNGWIAFCDPELLSRDVTFQVRAHGYELVAGASATFSAQPGHSGEIELRRVNIAERLYRVTGAGIYRDSVLLGEAVPLEQPVMSGLVVGQDSVLAAVYRGRIVWIWGDTLRPSYPLGNFHSSGAWSELPGRGGLDPSVGVNLHYYVDDSGFSKQMAPPSAVPGAGVTWLQALTVVEDASAAERLFAVYGKFGQDLRASEYGLVRFNDTNQEFEKVLGYPRLDSVRPEGHPVRWRHGAIDYSYYQNLVRVPARAEALLDPVEYETFSGYVAGSSTAVELDARGDVVYGWKKQTPVLTRDALIAAGIAPDQSLFGHISDPRTFASVRVHDNSSKSYSRYRGRFLQLVLELFGQSSLLGEIWYSEADTPMGPWAYATKIVSHDDYSFYNPRHHPFFDRNDGKTIFFEATYTRAFSGAATATPRYDYNQIMYRLRLDDSRLVLPVPIYDFSLAAGVLPGAFSDRRGIRPDMAPLAPAFFAPDRFTEGLVPVRWSAPSCAAARLTTTGGIGAPLFYAIAADASVRPGAAVPLYEYRKPDGTAYAYSADGALALSGLSRESNPIVYVWPSPLRVRFPVADYLPPLVADAGPDQCVTERAPGAGAVVRLDASDTRANASATIVEYLWIFDGGAQCLSARGQVAHVNLAVGTYAVELVVTDTTGATGRDALLIHVDG